MAATTQNGAFNSLLFFDRHVLNKEFGKVEGVVRTRRKPYIPVVLSRDEINEILKHLEPPYDLVVKLLYGYGLRLFACLGLRVQCMNFDAGASAPGRPYFYRTFIGEMISLIYSPAYIEKDVLYDAFTKKQLLPWRQEGTQLSLDDAKPPNWQIRFISTLCPRCGWDLEGEKDVLVMICRNCDSTWSCQKDTFEAVPFSVIPAAAAKESIIYLPFWRMKPRCEGVSLSSYTDLIRLANLPKAIQGIDETKPVYFWSPAFKVNPALFLRLGRQMTTIQPDVEANEPFASASVYQVTLSMQEAVESMMITLANMITDKRRIYPELGNIKVMADAIMLVYHPFKIGLQEFIHLTAPLAIDRQAMTLGVHL